MKDMYSFDIDKEALDISYALLHRAYTNVFSRCGLDFRPVEADSGAIGGRGSHEFMALAESGEAEIAYCDTCGYAASTEIASVNPVNLNIEEDIKEKELINTPDCTTIQEVSAFLNINPNRIVKSICYEADNKLIMVLIRGDRQVNEIKLKNALNCLELNYATDEVLNKAGLNPGYLGPIGGNSFEIIADDEIPLMINHVCGEGKRIIILLMLTPAGIIKLKELPIYAWWRREKKCSPAAAF